MTRLYSINTSVCVIILTCVSLFNQISACSCDSISAIPPHPPPNFAVLDCKPAGEISTNDNLTGFFSLYNIPPTASHESTKQKVAFFNKRARSKQRAAAPVS